jgi:hypothetical protein
MGYLGNSPAESYASFERQVFTIVNSQTAYTLNHAVTNENDIRLVVNNVVQEPGSGKAYTASGTTLTLSAALVNGTDEMYCVFLGRALQTVNPPNASVGTSQLAATSVTAAKLNNDIISGTTALASQPDDTDEFLVSDAGTLKRIDYSLIKGGGITEADMWNKRDSDQSISGDTTTTVTGWTRVTGTAFDKLGTGLSYNSSDGVFSFPSTGYYLIGCSLTFRDNANNSYMSNQIHTTTNNSSYGVVAMATQFQTADGSTNLFTSAYTQYLLDVTDTANVKFKIRVFGQSAFEVDVDTDRASCFITSVRLGDT